MLAGIPLYNDNLPLQLVFAKNFSPLVESGSININSLPAHILVRLLKRNNLAVASETVVFKVVNDYVNTNIKDLKQDQINELFETVRFPFMTLGKVQHSTPTPETQ